MYDSLNMHSLESSLIDIMRAEQDPMKGNAPYRLSVLRPGGSEVREMLSRSPRRPAERRGAGRPERPVLFSPHASLFSPPPRA